MTATVKKPDVPTETGPIIPISEAVNRADRRQLEALAGGKEKKDRTLGTSTGLTRRLGYIGSGPSGRFPGRVPWEISIPKHTESTEALRGLYPWLSGKPLPQRGPIFGREVISGGLWHIDPWEHRKLGRVGDSGIFISGVIGSGKSAGGKCLLIRHNGFGRPFVVPADIRGEWVPVVEAMDGLVLRLGPGMPDRLNALAMPPRPNVEGMTDELWWGVVFSHWQELLKSLCETLMPNQRELTPVETTAIEAALMAASGYNEASGQLARVKPISLHPVVELLLAPTQEMATTVRMDRDRLQDQIRDVGLCLRRLTEGSMKGLVDGVGNANRIDLSKPAMCVDMSRVQQNDAAVAMSMACTQSIIELAFLYQVQQWWIAYDEVWRMSRFGPLLQRMNSGQRRSRATGAGTVLISHRVTDSLMGGEVAQRAMLDMITDCATKIIYRQRADAIEATRAMVPMSNTVAAQLPTLPRGRAVHVVDGDAYLVDHLMAPKLRGTPGVDRPWTEWDVIETDQVLDDSYRSLASVSESALFADASGTDLRDLRT
ncbi:hypothetical protein ABIB25_000953 [Nakamurella sp. UYEF19]|uniref:hypothetical protein n=1 Tax=Nakamurella sp. UYEF19 TaxID=1756392 RepID=UPI0033983149